MSAFAGAHSAAFFGALAWVASGCASTVIPADAGASDAQPNGNLYVIHEAGGLLGMDTTTTLDPSGTVTVMNARTHSNTVTHASGGSSAAQMLDAQVAASGFFDVPARDYITGVVGGDLTQADLTVTHAGQTFHFVVYEDIPATPAPISAVIDDIRRYVAAAH